MFLGSLTDHVKSLIVTDLFLVTFLLGFQDPLDQIALVVFHVDPNIVDDEAFQSTAGVANTDPELQVLENRTLWCFPLVIVFDTRSEQSLNGLVVGCLSHVFPFGISAIVYGIGDGIDSLASLVKVAVLPPPSFAVGLAFQAMIGGCLVVCSQEFPLFVLGESDPSSLFRRRRRGGLALLTRRASLAQIAVHATDAFEPSRSLETKRTRTQPIESFNTNGRWTISLMIGHGRLWMGLLWLWRYEKTQRFSRL
mmetsp:Transcript_16070/g.36902  ORF Transcript_16070/g.36902 Transcript_16070/m.36902 type:complete len:252 (+) Transcript_16070:459-1214(+)